MRKGKKLKRTYGGRELIHEIKKLYRSGQTDYFFEPIVLTDNNDDPVGLIRDGDAVIFCCRRGEREIQLTRAFVDPLFEEFPVYGFKNLLFVSMTLYHEMFLNMPVKVVLNTLILVAPHRTRARTGSRNSGEPNPRHCTGSTFQSTGGRLSQLDSRKKNLKEPSSTGRNCRYR